MSLPYRAVNKPILPYTNLFRLNFNELTAIEARYRNVKAYTATAYQLQTPFNCLLPRAKKRWETRTEPLWWSVISHKSVLARRTVRSWASRKVKHALLESLRKKGFGRDGTGIDGEGKSHALYGTLQLSANSGIMTASVEDLLKQTDKVVEEIIRLQSATPYGDVAGKKRQTKQATQLNKPKPNRQSSRQKPPELTFRKKKV